MLERRRQWSFMIAADNAWYWRVRQPDGTECLSESTFGTLRACIADAAQHGYTLWAPEAERRTDRKLPPAASGAGISAKPAGSPDPLKRA